MSSISSSESDTGRRRRQASIAIKQSLRALSNQLSLLNHQVGARLALKDVDLDCLDLIARVGPLGPSAVAKRSGLHPATMTGILDRLEAGGWVARESDPSDRRAVMVRALSGRNAELLRLYSPMNRSMDKLCAGYREAELELLAEFLRRIADAGESATLKLMGE